MILVQNFDFKIQSIYIRLQIHSYYTSPDVCPILGYPYRGISFHKTLEGPRHQGKISSIDREIMKDIVSMTPRPQHVRQSIDSFITNRIRRNYIAMHWRYNDDDWSMHCKTNHGNQKTCNKILEIMHDASRMGKFFVDYLVEIKRTKNIDIMYIAAPPDEMDMLNRVKIEIMKMLPSVEIFLSTQVKIKICNTFIRTNVQKILYPQLPKIFSKILSAEIQKKITGKFVLSLTFICWTLFLDGHHCILDIFF